MSDIFIYCGIYRTPNTIGWEGPTIEGKSKMKTHPIQKVLLVASIFIIIDIVTAAGVAVMASLYFPTMLTWITPLVDSTTLAFMQSLQLFIPLFIGILVGLQIIYLVLVYRWRKNPLQHENGFIILGILKLLSGINISGILVLLAGLLIEEA